MAGALLVGFLIYVHLPHAFFRVWAERYVDLGRAKDSSQFEEIIAAILPAGFLHLQTIVVVWTGGFLLGCLPFEWAGSAGFPFPDAKLLLGLAEVGGYSRLGAYLDDPYKAMWPAAYYAALLIVTFLNGAGFGRGLQVGILLAADPVQHPQIAQPLPRGARLYVPAALAFTWKLWYQENLVSLYRLTLLRPFVFVKTRDGSLFHGRFFTYQKSEHGEITNIVITSASRFTREKIRDALRRGENPIHPLRGSIVLKWEEVLDLNETVPGEIERLFRQYEVEREKCSVAEKSPLAQPLVRPVRRYRPKK